MKATSQFLIFILILSLSGCSKNSNSQRKPDLSKQQADGPEIKAATPEEPGPVATVASPMTTLTKRLAGEQEGADEPQVMSAADHVDAMALPPPNRFLHKQFTVTSYSEFVFTVPPHTVHPTLRGNFRAFTQDAPESTTAKPAVIDLMVMNEEEFGEFVRGRPADFVYEADSSSNQTVKYTIPHTLDRAQTYHVVFRNPREPHATVVEADFTISFE